MKNNIRVIVVPVGEEPYVLRIDRGLKAMQDVVGGYIQAVALEDNVDIVCNEEGKLIGLPMNRRYARIQDVIRGDFLISRHRDGDAVDVTDDDILTYTNMFSLHPKYAHA